MPERERAVVLFAGPSAHGVPRAVLTAGGVRLRPPVRRGDVQRLAARHDPGVIVLCDGVFQSAPAVSHAEICDAMDRGWEVWGVSSIGAIRAYELRAEGMRGFGYVRSLFDRVPDFTDDEMCLLHFPEAPFFPVSEALVNLRYALEQQRSALRIPPRSEQRLIAAMQALWFGDRTEERIREAMRTVGGFEADVAERLLQWLRAHRVKTLDLVALMTQRPWVRRRR